VTVDKEALQASYRARATDELLSLHATGALTNVAFEVLERELVTRGVPPPPRPQPAPHEDGRRFRSVWPAFLLICVSWSFVNFHVLLNHPLAERLLKEVIAESIAIFLFTGLVPLLIHIAERRRKEAYTMLKVLA